MVTAIRWSHSGILYSIKRLCSASCSNVVTEMGVNYLLRHHVRGHNDCKWPFEPSNIPWNMHFAGLWRLNVAFYLDAVTQKRHILQSKRAEL